MQPRKSHSAPPANKDITCNWCNEQMLGGSLARHNKTKSHEYSSFCIVAVPGQTTLTNFFNNNLQKTPIIKIKLSKADSIISNLGSNRKNFSL